MNWLDEGALYSQIPVFLREDLGRGDVTSQAIVARNTRARGRFVAGEKMIVAGLEAAEEVFISLDSQPQLEAFVADGEEIEAGKVIVGRGSAPVGVVAPVAVEAVDARRVGVRGDALELMGCQRAMNFTGGRCSPS